ncbi:hypothetical protein Tco_1450023 [Tanacetum coccineum]
MVRYGVIVATQPPTASSHFTFRCHNAGNGVATSDGVMKPKALSYNARDENICSKINFLYLERRSNNIRELKQKD